MSNQVEDAKRLFSQLREDQSDLVFFKKEHVLKMLDESCTHDDIDEAYRDVAMKR